MARGSYYTMSSVGQAATTIAPHEGKSALHETFDLFVEAIRNQSEQAEAEGLLWGRFGGLVAYGCSTYGLATLLVSVLLNRTSVIASSNHRRVRRVGGLLRTNYWTQTGVVLLLRLLAVVLLAIEAYHCAVALGVMQANYPASAVSRLTRWLPQEWVRYDVVLFSASKYMAMPRNEVRLGPTSLMLWPVFLAVCLSLFVETFAAALDGRKPFLEGGVTLFELSLAFQEMTSGFYFMRPDQLVKRPSEQVLMVCLFALADHVSGHLGAVLYANKYRLIPLTAINVCFVWYFASTALLGAILKFPFNIILTYISLVFVLLVTLACAAIFALAVVAKNNRLLELSYAKFFVADEENEFFAKHLGVTLDQDFYTAAMNVGLFAISLAGKSSYISEWNVISGPQFTWLEDKLWQKLWGAFSEDEIADLDTAQSAKVLAYLKENKLSGYSNIVSSPSSRMISGTAEDSTQQESTLKVRLLYILEIASRFWELLYSLVARSFLLSYLPGLFKRYVLRKTPHAYESEEEFAARRSRAPGFVRRYMRRRLEEPGASQQDVIVIDVDSDSDDDSPDFEVLEQSDVDSDVESVDLSLGVLVRDGAEMSPMGELMTADGFTELIEEREVLHHHLRYDYANEGMMTRSRYNALHEPTSLRDEASALLELILSTRKEKLREAPKLTEEYDLDPRLACVICQVNPREVITWPCKCFAICESCRLSLVTQGMEGCVCCRRDVEGVSRVYLP